MGGIVLAAAYVDARGVYVEASEVEEHDGVFTYNGETVTRESGKMGKSLKNSVTPDDICDEYGADTLRLYEMFMGPLDASRSWNTADIIGVHRFLQRLWRNAVDENTGAAHVSDVESDDETRRLLHRTIAAVRADLANLRFNTAIARLTELNNRLTTVVARDGSAPREVVEPLVLMTAPLAPHIAEELWQLTGHAVTLTYEPFPEAEPAWLVEEEVEIGVQVDGKVRARVMVPAGADDAAHESAGRADAKVAALLAEKPVRKTIVVRGRLVNFIR
jgi:leucyl-tRNA synthetase